MLLNLQRQRRLFHPIRALTSFISGIDYAQEQSDQALPSQAETQIITGLDIAIAGIALALVLFVNMFL